MKKILTICLALAMMFALSVNVFAADSQVTLDNSDKSHELPVTVKINTQYKDVYSVDLKWQSLDFTHWTVYDWNSSSLEYEVDTHYWSGTYAGKALITITNHSSRNITVTAAYTTEPDTKDVTVDLYVSNGTCDEDPDATTLTQTVLKPADSTVDSKFYTVAVTGEPDGTVSTDPIQIATVTITVS